MQANLPHGLPSRLCRGRHLLVLTTILTLVRQRSILDAPARSTARPGRLASSRFAPSWGAPLQRWWRPCSQFPASVLLNVFHPRASLLALPLASRHNQYFFTLSFPCPHRWCFPSGGKAGWGRPMHPRPHLGLVLQPLLRTPCYYSNVTPMYHQSFCSHSSLPRGSSAQRYACGFLSYVLSYGKHATCS